MEEARKKILIVDDDELNRVLLGSIFESEYEIVEAENGLLGLEALYANREDISAVLLDMMMPVMDGMGFLQEMKKQGLVEQIPVFVVTAEPEAKNIYDAYNIGVMDVIGKPVVPYIVSKRVGSVVELFEARKKLRARVADQDLEIMLQQQKIIEINDGMIEALFSALEARSGETSAHVRNIRAMTRLLLEKTEMGNGISEDEIELIAIGAMMHDIGKISVPDAVLNKPGRLTDEEYTIMKDHTRYGAKILSDVKQLHQHNAYNYAYDIAIHHHERYDGRGYPEGLKGDEITPWAQVVSIADVYDALISPRCYKKPFPREVAVQMIQNNECGVFNPQLVECFVRVEPEIHKALYEQ